MYLFIFISFLYPNTETQAHNIMVISIKWLQWVALHKHHPEVFVLISSTKIQKNSLWLPMIVKASKRKYSHALYKKPVNFNFTPLPLPLEILILTLPSHLSWEIRMIRRVASPESGRQTKLSEFHGWSCLTVNRNPINSSTSAKHLIHKTLHNTAVFRGGGEIVGEGRERENCLF